MTNHRTLAGLLSLCGAIVVLPGSAAAQNDPDAIQRLRRDQDEILRKAERLQALMQRLQQRFEREGKTDQIRLLQEGMAHLERSGLLRDVASIRDDLAAAALTEALRKQKDVVDDLERLLNILLERKSVEQIEQQMHAAAEQAATARDLERRQSELIDATQRALQTDASAAQKQLLDALAELAAAERREAERNARQAGSRRPFLESALERVRALLRDQDRLDAAATAETAGRSGETREREFDLGSLAQRTRDLERRVADQAQQEALAEAARALRDQAAGTDAQALQQARDRLEVLAQDAPRLAGPEGPVRDPRWGEIAAQLQQATDPASPAAREQLGKLGAAAEDLARQRANEARAANTKEAGRLAGEARQFAERLRQQEPAGPAGDGAKDTAATAVAEAAEKLAAAERAEQNNEVGAARERVNEAAAALDQARSRHQEQNPDAARKAAQMAAEAAATAQEVRNAPSAETAEQDAGDQLERAAQALRDTETGLEAARDAGRRPDVAAPTKAAREALQAAEKALDGALQASNAGGGEERAAAAQRQQELQKAADEVGRRMQDAASSGQLTDEQRKRAAERLAEAQRSMQDATQKLQSGQQASASGAQQQAADALQKAGEELQKNQPLTDRQRQELAEQAKRQQELADDIVRLAQELKKRQNKAAERAAEQAAEAARKARTAMEQGDPQETEQQQEEARQKLQEAAEELEEEKDRYQDLRQEELLFRMRDELVQFLERQRPITAQTLEAQKTPAEGLSRPVRRKLNQLGEEEGELAGRIEFLVTALGDEGNLVYRSVLSANLDDLREIARRLAGRAPDPGSFTTMLQQDVERRSEDLLKALERERQRREQERQQQQQDQQEKGRNRLNDQREKLVSLIAELEMLRQLGQDTRRANDNLRTLVESRGSDPTTDAEAQMIERLAHRHGEITRLFQQIKRDVEASMQAMQEQEGQDQEGGRGR